MKKYLLFLFTLCCIGGQSVFAQDSLHISSNQIALTILNKIDHEVVLTEKQKTEVLKLLTVRSEQIEKVKSKETHKRLSKASLKGINQGAYNQLKKILTEEQFNKLQLLRKETRQQKEKYTAEQVYQSDQDLELDF